MKKNLFIILIGIYILTLCPLGSSAYADPCDDGLCLRKREAVYNEKEPEKFSHWECISAGSNCKVSIGLN